MILAPRPFEAFVNERRMMRTLGLATLKGSKIGIDVSHYIESIFRSDSEPLVQALGGFPFSLLERFNLDLACLKSYGITPIFVFDGLNVTSQQPITTKSTNRTSALSTTPSGNVTFATQISNTLHKRNQAWDDYEKRQAEQAVRGFEQVSETSFDIKKQFGVRTLLNYFLDQEPPAEYLVAPYTATSQLVYLQNEAYIDAIMGSLDLFLYSTIDRIILHMDHRGNNGAGNFNWISKKQTLYDLGLTHEQFVEAYIISDSVSFAKDMLYPPINQQLLAQVAGGPAAATAAITTAGSAVAAGLYSSSSPFNVAYDYVAASPPSFFPTLVSFSKQEAATEDSYVVKFQKVYATILYQPVLKDDGKVEPIPPENEWPNDIHSFIGNRLPDETFFYLSKGLIGPELLNAITSSYFFEPAPLDGGRVTVYRRFVSQQNEEITRKSFSFLTQTMHRYFQYKPINLVYWHDLNRDHELQRLITPVFYQTMGWKVSDELLESEYAAKKLSKYQSQFARLLCLFTSTNDSEEDVRTFISSSVYKKKPGASTPPNPSTASSPAPAPASPAKPASAVPVSSNPPGTSSTSHAFPAPVLNTVNELVSNAIWRVFQAIGLFNNEHNLTPWGKIIAQVMDVLETDPEYKPHAKQLSEPLLLSLLLARDGFLNSNKLEPEYSGGPDPSASPEIQSHILLLSRIASYVALRHNPVGFAGPLSRTILAFQSIIARQYASYREIIEAAIVSILTNGEADRVSLRSSKSPKDKSEPAKLSEDFVWKEVVSSLPFVQPPNCGTGVAMKTYLDKIAINSSKGAEVDNQKIVDDLKNMFKQAVDVSGDIGLAFKLWKLIYKAIVEAEEAGLLSASANRQFHSANSWVKSYII